MSCWLVYTYHNILQICFTTSVAISTHQIKCDSVWEKGQFHAKCYEPVKFMSHRNYAVSNINILEPNAPTIDTKNSKTFVLRFSPRHCHIICSMCTVYFFNQNV